jgi:hypothetical protein
MCCPAAPKAANQEDYLSNIAARRHLSGFFSEMDCGVNQNGITSQQRLCLSAPGILATLYGCRMGRSLSGMGLIRMGWGAIGFAALKPLFNDQSNNGRQGDDDSDNIKTVPDASHALLHKGIAFRFDINGLAKVVPL